jgi:hypothetical protein
LLSVLIAPYIFLVSLPGCASRIIDFFREFTLHVESLGYVCSFAVFDFKRHGNVAYGAPTDALDDYQTSKGGKMESSFLNFRAQHPTWSPNADGSNFFANIVSRQRPMPGQDPGESMMASEWSAPANEGNGIGRQIFRLLDAVYETNRGII